MNALSIRNLRKTYSNGFTALKGIDLEVESGDFFALLGPNGAGKSSLMRCLYRVNKPTEGSVSFDGQNIWQYTAKQNAKNIAVILQDHTDQLGLTVSDVISQGLTPHKHLFEWDTHDDRKQIQNLLVELDLYQLRNSPFSLLSGGEKQRVAIARTILKNPKIFFFDEATSALDTSTEKEIQKNLESVSKDKTTLIIAHRLSTAANADNIIVLDKGIIIEQGTHDSLLLEKGKYFEMWEKQKPN